MTASALSAEPTSAWRKYAAAFAVFVMALGGVVGLSGPAEAASGDIRAPFDVGQTWNICRGYNYASHTGTSNYGIDLTGAGCDNSAAGRNVRAPKTGTVAYFQTEYGNLCVNTPDGGSYTLTHINSSFNTGDHVTPGLYVGKVAAAQPNFLVPPRNNGVAHIHFQMWSAPGCYNGSSIPLDDAHNARICGETNLVASRPNNGNGSWSGTEITSHTCGTTTPTPPPPPPPPVDTDGDGLPDEDDQCPAVSGGDSITGCPDPTQQLGGDFNGDGFEDVVMFYEYPNTLTKAWISYGSSTGLQAPTIVWASDGWIWDKMKFSVGDFNNDGRDDVGLMYEYPNVRVKLWQFDGTATGLADPVTKWDSGTGNWAWDKTKLSAGDFDGDGHGDMAMLYEYPDNVIKVWISYGSASDLQAPVMVWQSDGWIWSRIKMTSGDFDNDGRDDLGMLYQYPNSKVKLWQFNGTTTGLADPVMKWDSGENNWVWSKTKLSAGDFDGDSRDDVVMFYERPNALTRVWIANGSAGGLQTPTMAWESDGWNWQKLKFSTGDFNGDGRADVGLLYDYPSSRVKLWQFNGTATDLADPVLKWDSGTNSWIWLRVKLAA